MRHIVILTHPNDRFTNDEYVLGVIADQWRERGMKVTVLAGPGNHVDADIAVLHADLTIVPNEYLEFMKGYPVAINPKVKDISKRRISANVVTRGDGYDGPVIVKTNFNCGGIAEGMIAQNVSLLSKYIRAVRRRLHWSMRAELDIWEYPIFDSVKQVPWPVWHNRDLVVERFLPERRDGFYCMRTWLFLGDAEMNVVMYGNQPIMKSPVAVRIEYSDTSQIPGEIRKMRQDLGFEFGKFDYGIVDGRVVLYDANKTPAAPHLPAMLARVKMLASGIESLFPRQLRAAG